MKCRLLIILITQICFIFSIVELNTKYRKTNDANASANANVDADVSSKFKDIINEVRTLKIGLFGDPDENMDFYKRNKKAYDPKIIEKMTKIGKILELEELLEFYTTNKRKFLTKNTADVEADAE